MRLIVAGLALMLVACNGNKPATEITDTADSLADKVAEREGDIAPWANDLIEDYFTKKGKELNANDTVPLAYMKEYQERNGKTYLAVRIGRNMQTQFTTENWLYIDSATHTVYEYDVANDTLVLFK